MHIPLIILRYSFILTLMSLSYSVSAQSGTKWATNGNSAGSGDFLGTTNNEPLVVKTNGLQRLSVSATGSVQINSLSGSGTGLITADGSGSLSRTNFSGNSSEFLGGDGQFHTLSNAAGWTVSGNNVYHNPGNVGIGTTSPQYLLDVNGDAWFSGTVYATGVILTNKLLADTMKATEMFSLNNNMHMSAGGLNQIYTSNGDLRIQSNANVNVSNVIIGAGTNGNVGVGTFSPQYKLDIYGDANVSGRLSVYRIVPNSADSLIRFGDSTVSMNPYLGNIYNGNTSGYRGMGIGVTAYGFGLHSTALGYRVKANGEGSIVIGASNTAGILANNIPSSLMVGFNSNIATLFVGSANGNGTTGNVGIGTSQPNSKLQVGDDYRRVAIGEADGMLYSGYFGSSYLGFNAVRQPGNNWIAKSDGAHNGSIVILSDINGGFRIAQLPSENPGSSDKTWTSHDVLNNTIFQIRPDGRFVMGLEGQLGGSLDNSGTRLTVDGGIACKKLNVTLNNWADSVFNPSYYLMPLDSVEKFIITYGHLPGLPSEKEVKTNGVDLAQNDVMLLAKLEEIVLYQIEMEKRLEQLENENAELRKSLEQKQE